MKTMRKRILGIACAAMFAVSNVIASPAIAEFARGLASSGSLHAAAAVESGVKLEAYGGSLASDRIQLQNGKLPQLPIPTREGYDFVGWFTDEVEVNYWGDVESETNSGGKLSWQKLKETYGDAAGYKYLNGRPTSWYDEEEKPDPNYPDDAGYDWEHSRWIEHSVGLMNATKGEKAEEGSEVAEGSTLYAMYDPKNITVYWYNNGWNDSHDTWSVSTGRSSGAEYGGKIAYLPLDKWDPWAGHTFKGWMDEKGNQFDFDLESEFQLTKTFYTPEKYEPILRLYAVYDNVTAPEGGVENATFERVVGSGGYFDPNGGSYTFNAVFDSRYKARPDIKWEITSGGEFFELQISADKLLATVVAKKDAGEEIAKENNLRIDVRFSVGSESVDVYATASHNWDDGRILSGWWDRCTSPMVVEYTCRTCKIKKNGEFPPDGHRYTRYRSEATCTEDAVEDRYCVVCGKTEHEILEGTALGHQWRTTTVKGCGGTIVTSTCCVCGTVETQEDHTACHSWNSSYTVDRAATCTTEGSKSIHCKNCNAVKESVSIPATGHNYRNTTVEATCTSEGYTSHKCTVCGDSYRDAVMPAKGHDFDEQVERGCNGAEITVKTCKDCGESETIGDRNALGHVWSEYHVDQAPTCTKEGSESVTCTVCGALKEKRSIPAKGHSYQVTLHEATCTEEGYTVSVCTVCGDTVREKTADPKGHDYDVETQTGCNGAKFVKKTCKVCGDIVTEGSLDDLGHVWSGYHVDQAPTCTIEGSESVTCTVCGALKEKRAIPAKGHNYNVETQTGCNGAKFVKKTCKVCGDIVTEGSLDDLDHVWSEYHVDQAPTCTKEGSESVTCTVCGALKEKRSIPAKEHKYVVTPHEATCTEEGYTVSVCSVCGDTVRAKTADPKGHDYDVETQTGCNGAIYVKKTCKVCGDIVTEGSLEELGHVWSEYHVDQAPTCTKEGSESVTCTVCGALKEERTIPTEGHKYEVTPHEATCTEEGYTVSVCSVCGDTVREKTADPKGHDYDVETQIGCNGAIYVEKTCKVCGDIVTEGSIDDLDHVWSEYHVDQAPTCTTEGSESVTCTVCGALKEKRSISAEGHSYQVTPYEATCTEEGYTVSVCTVCGDTVREKTADPKGHVAADAVAETAPTCHSDGVKNVYCAVCGYLLESEEIPADPALHHWSEWETVISEDTETQTRSCTECGKEEKVVRSVPKAKAPETEVPETEVPETEVPETEVPETEAPETVAPETETPKANAPENEEEFVSPKNNADAENLKHVSNAEGGEHKESALWIWIALGTLCGAALICTPTAIVLKRRKTNK